MHTIFFLHLPPNLDLLKAQLKEYPGDIRPSFQTKGFATFIVDDRARQAILREPPFLCLAWGFGAKRVEHSPSVWTERDQLIFVEQDELFFRDPKDNVWHAPCAQFSQLAQLAQLQLPENSPSRAWLKIAQAFKLIERPRQGHALEIGSAPGGASLFLLQQNLCVIGIDPGEMHPSIIAHDNFKHLKKSVHDVGTNDLSTAFDLLAVDTNLPPLVSMREALRLAEFSKQQLKELFLTIKLPSPRLVRGLAKYQRQLGQMGLRSRFIQLPSHHREILLYGYRD